MKIVYDERKWNIMLILDRIRCPYLKFPANIYECNHANFGYGSTKNSLPECNMDICPIKLVEKKYNHQLTKGD
uniref:Uncharacterized protein n=1 Tax=viral metagenome TaxID=1070528 RepID=A0A6H1ZRM6_9ZZZZ